MVTYECKTFYNIVPRLNCKTTQNKFYKISQNSSSGAIVKALNFKGYKSGGICGWQGRDKLVVISIVIFKLSGVPL